MPTAGFKIVGLLDIVLLVLDDLLEVAVVRVVMVDDLLGIISVDVFTVVPLEPKRKQRQ